MGGTIFKEVVGQTTSASLELSVFLGAVLTVHRVIVEVVYVEVGIAQGSVIPNFHVGAVRILNSSVLTERA